MSKKSKLGDSLRDRRIGEALRAGVEAGRLARRLGVVPGEAPDEFLDDDDDAVWGAWLLAFELGTQHDGPYRFEVRHE
jgi:hypothetical protein